jgi:xanthosine utilization system XapX-like protein
MFKSNLIAGLIGIGILCGFLGIYIVRVSAPPLIIIMMLVIGMMIYDFVLDLREIRRNSGK